MDTTGLNALKRRYNIIGSDPQLMLAIERAVRVAPVDMSVLVVGENGSGKEIFARIIHDNSNRSRKPFFAINCGALSEGTINSELFGHVKGAFTDAISDHKGYFESADGGTLFLDEVGELPLETQARLLRVLESGEFIKMGSSKVQKTNVRIVAATNKNLQHEIAAGRFREDLYYRLAQVQISIPPLRERGNDILLLFDRFKIDFANTHKLEEVTLLEDAKERLKRYRWPGNVRQLKNLTEQIALLEAGHTLDAQALSTYLPENGLVVAGDAEFSYEHDREILFRLIGQLSHEIKLLQQLVDLNPDIIEKVQSLLTFGHRELPAPSIPYTSRDALQREPFQLKEHEDFTLDNEAEMVASEEYHETPRKSTLKEMEINEIAGALKRQGGNRKRTAEELGISERTLYRKIKEYELN